MDPNSKGVARWTTPAAIIIALLIALAAAMSSWRRMLTTNKTDAPHAATIVEK